MPSDDPIAHAQAVVSAACAGGARVLEAGCGSRSHLHYPPSARVIGVDLLRTQLARHAGGSLLAQGDVTALPVASRRVDVVVCWDVLEHLAAPANALAEIARVLRPGGVAVLALPNILSLKGLVTRATPWWFHVWVYRRVLGDRTAGTDASDQFPTAFGVALRPAGLRRMAARAGLRVDDVRLYEGPVPRHLRARYRAADVALGAASRATRLLSGGRYDTTHSDMIVVLTRAETPPA